MVRQPLTAVRQVNDAALPEAVFLKAALHRLVDAVGIGTQVPVLLTAPFQAKAAYPAAVRRHPKPVDHAVGRVIQPRTIVNLPVGRLLPAVKQKTASGVPSSSQHR